MEDISWGGTSSLTTRRQKWRGHALSRGGVVRIAFFSKHRFPLSPHRDPRFEGSHFLTTKPFAYWKRNMEPGGSFSFSKIKANDFKDACEECQIISFNCARAS